MNRSKRYQNGFLSAQGWKMLVSLAEGLFGGPPERIYGRVFKDDGFWGYDAVEDFLADVVPDNSELILYFKTGTSVSMRYEDGFIIGVDKTSKSAIIDFEREAETLINQQWIEAPAKPLEKLVIFIGHGRTVDWRDLKDHLHEKHGIQVEAYETGSREGHAIRDILQDMLDRSTLAILVHTPEDELLNGTFNSRPNVIHETGLFQGKLGFSSAVVLLKDGTTEFSNLAGIQQIRYSDIRQTFGDVLAWIRRETSSVKDAAAEP